MEAGIRELVLCVVTLLAALGCARYYVLAVMDRDRALSRAAAVGFFVFTGAAVIFLLRSL